ncbi:hypothetical protein [Clostridium frigidicarnis]|uniref:VCBS repeat-containing protein n=1 Tax=Clostridium frigidicarnis TaxID=84698 RepID=A0A1I0W7Y6_9CLOT|nr:hypothetical protein [Clostridium frigidicarnis]SFA84398.1 hypothetical protein SAMN04488528_100497 [Clostridium frigidicarnis]
MDKKALINLISYFLPENAHLSFTNNNPDTPSITIKDLDNNNVDEISCRYKLYGVDYSMTLKWSINQWDISEVTNLSSLSYIRNSNTKLDSKIILSEDLGDVDGDGYLDKVYLTGTAPFNNTKNYIDDITLVVEYGNKKTDIIPLKVNGGFNPKVGVYNLINRDKKEILISIVPGGSGGYVFYYIYSFIDTALKNIFDFEEFNKKTSEMYTVLYKPNYNVEIANTLLKKKYLINLSLNPKEYLSFLYKDDGTLKSDFKGSISSLVGLYPISLENDGTFKLLAIENIIGIATKDILGSIQVYLQWQDSSFKPFAESVAIDGVYFK